MGKQNGFDSVPTLRWVANILMKQGLVQKPSKEKAKLPTSFGGVLLRPYAFPELKTIYHSVFQKPCWLQPWNLSDQTQATFVHRHFTLTSAFIHKIVIASVLLPQLSGAHQYYAIESGAEAPELAAFGFPVGPAVRHSARQHLCMPKVPVLPLGLGWDLCTATGHPCCKGRQAAKGRHELIHYQGRAAGADLPYTTSLPP